MTDIAGQNPIPVLHAITRLIVGGAQENTMYTAARLDKLRYAVEILSGPQTGSEGSLIEEVRTHGVPLTILPDMLRQVSPLHDLKALIEMRRLMQRKRYTIVHTHSSKAGILGRLAARLAGVPVIVHTVHGWSFHDYMSPPARLVYVLLERWMASFSDALIAVTRQDIQKGVQYGIGKPGQYRLIHSAIPLDEFSPERFDGLSVRQELGIPAEAVVVGNVGRFSVQKNPLDWVRVASRVARERPKAWFLLVGDGPLRGQVEEMLRTEGLSGRTVLTGLRRDIARVLSAMDIFLLTSLWEGLPRVLPQAMAMGIPVVANRADGTQEAIQDGETGYLCSPCDTATMARLCCELVIDPQKRKEMGQAGRHYAAREFDLTQMIVQITELYEELLSS